MSAWTELFGSKPIVPSWAPVTLQQQQAAASSSNQQNLPSLENLASSSNQFNTSQLTEMLNKILPGFSDSATQAGKNISSELSGQIPKDVADAIQQSTAAQALTGGFGGSGLMGNTLAKNLGLTSLQLTQQGQSNLESWSAMIDQMFAPGMMNVSSMFVSPQQMFQDTMANQENQFNRDWLSSQVSAMPNPVAAGIEGMVSGLGSSLTGGLLNTAGSSGGGGGGGLLSMLI